MEKNDNALKWMVLSHDFNSFLKAWTDIERDYEIMEKHFSPQMIMTAAPQMQGGVIRTGQQQATVIINGLLLVREKKKIITEGQ